MRKIKKKQFLIYQLVYSSSIKFIRKDASVSLIQRPPNQKLFRGWCRGRSQNWPVVVDSEVDSSQKEEKVVDSVLVNTCAWCTAGSLRSLVAKFKIIILFDKIVHAMITAASKIIELEIKQIASFTIEELTMHPAWLFSLLCFFTWRGPPNT